MMARRVRSRPVIRGEIRAGDEETRNQLRGEMRALHEDSVGQIQRLRAEMHALYDDALAQMRILNEDVIGRLSLLQGGLGSRRRRPVPPGAKRKR